jgi:hypothetical protein
MTGAMERIAQVRGRRSKGMSKQPSKLKVAGSNPAGVANVSRTHVTSG